jgi:protein-tyrosine-phosphatase
MALIHSATLVPTKTELLADWLPRQPWFPAAAQAGVEPERVGAFRFDDPAGEVGVETLIVRVPGAPPLQVPLSYRGSPLDGAERWLVGTMEHSVLGRRWVYDALGDPVYLSELAKAALQGGTEVEQFRETPEGRVEVPSSAHVRGSGEPGAPVPDLAELEIEVVRVLDGATDAGAAPTLAGTWPGQPEPMVLASVRPRGAGSKPRRAAPTVLFVCVHNGGRSQMAAGFLEALAGDRVAVYSAGSEPAEQLNPVAVAAMAELGIDIASKRPRLLTTDAVRASDVVITMGCGDACPVFPGRRYEDWQLDDPAGLPLERVRPIRDEIEARVRRLLSELG